MGFFKRAAKTQVQSNNQLANAFEDAMPDAAFAKARNEYYDSVGQPVVDRARLFVICILLLVIVVVLSFAFLWMIPLKTTEPYVIAIDDTNGRVSKAAGEVKRAVEYTPDRPVLERELFQFVERLYAINADYPKLVQDGHVAAYAYTRNRASNEFRSFMDVEQPYQRQKTTKGLIRKAERKTISFREDGKLVLIRFRTSERSEDRPVPVGRDWVMTLQFAREQPTTPQELDLNPLGMYITHFEIGEER
ncbi:Type IV secretory pathway component VirB8-like (plasmid) [Rhodoferax ferrireducens T118]|uniref:Type IV secretory pathway component VirB8-like n=1 Tax=Albidiferax ferrireducens (strain ATCC BAA-621 / DSM 15236 / T118) TaxID=338969 RepID=Q21QK4_ALBFT|nr:type IV secretion system protein [Rhodoferax ferrireducens]ABD71941.1 Type IV secretory pathway component VirB8-like [Rhodoferax ferrireducens T118]